MIINKSGITIRMEVKDLRVMGRATQGVKLINLNKKDQISSVAKIEIMEEEEIEEGETSAENPETSDDSKSESNDNKE